MTGSERSVRFDISEGVAELVLNRPAQLNAMTPEMVDQINAAVEQARDSARVLLVSATGRGFSAGRDIAGADPGAEDGGQVLTEIFNPMLQRVADLPFPTIAAVHGACLGVGLGLALACDVIFAAADAKFGSPFNKIGAVLDSGAHKVFVERLGAAVTLDLIYSGRFLSGTEAAAAGLVSRAVPTPELAETALDYARGLAQGPALAFAESKRLVREINDNPVTLARCLELEAGAQSRSSATRDYVEGFTAFLQRRQPTFTGA
ncbi:MAG: enoyl-CoA hydratase-related protein [Microlunatus sp.]|nr:enoyl-CoA hydratase-related protein [Microlunatus sp.]MDN5769678.1 enoyl-CoA hydratase-related protein [Microlunatus sp.]MDN5803308.1 enoyl-CoA hydratase-related protein [Microlunatus sp.]